MNRARSVEPCKPPVIAYLANLFPSPLEPYVVEEIQELREHGARL